MAEQEYSLPDISEEQVEKAALPVGKELIKKFLMKLSTSILKKTKMNLNLLKKILFKKTLKPVKR